MDVVFTSAGTAITGVSGILINLILVKYFGSAGLGVFSLAFSIFLLFYFVASVGIHHSVTKHSAEEPEASQKIGVLTSSALLMVSLTSISVALLCWVISPLISSLLDKGGTFLQILFVLATALPAFCINKSLLGLLNGLRKMKHFSLLPAAKHAMVVAGILLLSARKLPLEEVVWAFPVAELAMTVVLIACSFNHLRMPNWQDLKLWITRHAPFGFQMSLNELFAEFQFKLDVILIGYFLPPGLLGVYVFAADIVKGLLRFPVIIQQNFNPVVAHLWASGNRIDLSEKMKKVRRMTYVLFAPLVAICTIAYPLLVQRYVSEVSGYLNYLVFYILLLGVLIYSGYIAIIQLLSNSGFAHLQARLRFYALLTNLVGSLALIPTFGLIGAAISTSISLVSSIYFMNVFTKRYMNFDSLRLVDCHA